MNLVAGYDPTQVRDEEGLANFVGVNLYYVMILTFGIAIADYLGYRSLWVVYVVVLLGLVLRMQSGTSRYS